MKKARDPRMTVDPGFRRVLAFESMGLGFPSLKKYTKYLAQQSIKDNKKLRELLKENGKDEIFQ